MFRTIFCAVCLSLLSGCSTTRVGLNYAAGAGVTRARVPDAATTVGNFVDHRGEPSTWLGSIRGGYGNPIKTLEADKPVSTIVHDAFVAGLGSRGVRTDSPAAPLHITGTIRTLDGNQMVRREANVEIEVAVLDAASGQQRFQRTYSTTNVDGSILSLSTGIFGSVEDLRAVVEKTLRETVDKALDDPALRAALGV